MTKLPLAPMPLAEAEARLSGGAPLVSRQDGPVPATGRTTTVLVRADGACAYPVLEGIPILLGPERLTPPDGLLGACWDDETYAEAYAEMAFYNRAAQDRAAQEDADLLARLAEILTLPASERERFPEPPARWLDATYEPAAELDAYRHVSPLRGRTVLQLGGRGTLAAKFLAAGAVEAALVTPMPGEATYAVGLVDRLGLEDRLTAVVGVAEELPFPDGTFDVVYAGGTFHHTVTALAAAEVSRVLRTGGRFAAVEPWQAPLYDLGIRVFGKRENVPCRPMTAERAAPVLAALEDGRVTHHGTITRYPLLALAKLGVPMRLETVRRVTAADDKLCSLVPSLRRYGSSSAILACRS
ncbi:MAG: class I SAM-dependent methyltransferase [Acidimicrobiia bacterium]